MRYNTATETYPQVIKDILNLFMTRGGVQRDTAKNFKNQKLWPNRLVEGIVARLTKHATIKHARERWETNSLTGIHYTSGSIDMRKVLENLSNEPSSSEMLRKARDEAGISQIELEEITGIRRSNISALENARMTMTAHYAEILGAALKLHPADLLYPNRKVIKSDEIKMIEKKAEAVLKRHEANSLIKT